ncbi:MAG: universal stress protein [Halobacteriaceae archaeon]
MASHVLVPYDGSEQADQALDHAFEEHGDATVSVLHVIDPVEAGYTSQPTAFGQAEEWFESAKEEAGEMLDTVEARADDAGVAVETAIEVGRPSRTIVEYADEEGVDHIVMGSHGRSGVSRILLGSVAEAVVRRSPVPVTIVR